MKIKEAIDIINGMTSTVSVKESNDVLQISSKNTAIYGDWFLKMPMNAISWESIRKEWGGLSPDIKAIDLARVMDVIQRLLDTPVEERFPEKKYHLATMRCIDGSIAIKQYVSSIAVGSDDVKFYFGNKENAGEWTDTNLNWLSQLFPEEAIKAMKEEVKDDED